MTSLLSKPTTSSRWSKEVNAREETQGQSQDLQEKQHKTSHNNPQLDNLVKKICFRSKNKANFPKFSDKEKQ